MIGARDRLRAVFAGAGYQLRPLVDADLTLRPGESVHYGGTVRMHADPRLGMVDGHNRLHAVRNVYVVDQSAFTTGPEKKPTLTAMAIAARAMTMLPD